jgi:6-phosphogluconolactonase
VAPFVIVALDERALAQHATEIITRAAAESMERSGRFTLALSGGRTPLQTYTRLASAPIDWTRLHIFWGDERCVPPTHPESNFGGASAFLLTKVPIPSSQIYRMRGEDPDPERAAADYAKTLNAAFGLDTGRLPRFDLILLGMGADGHTASLFPGTAALKEVSRSVVAVSAEELRSHRLTLTLPALNAAAHVLFLVEGTEKAPTLKAVLQNGPSERYPASLVKPVDGRLTWVVDRAAAELIAGGESTRGN